MLAASTASALPASMASRRWSRFPAPPLAITGTDTRSEMARTSSTSYPLCWPSVSMLVTSSSPAPRAAARSAHFSASMPVAFRPPCVYTSQADSGSSARVLSSTSGDCKAASLALPLAIRLTSMATTMHWLPKKSDASRTSSGSRTAAVLSETLSAPASSICRTSSTDRRPPPTVNGMNTRSETRLTTSIMMSLASALAVMSRKTSSSAPSRS